MWTNPEYDIVYGDMVDIVNECVNTKSAQFYLHYIGFDAHIGGGLFQ